MILAIEFHGISNVSSGEACVAEIGGRSEALVDQYVAEGKTAEAVALLFDLIVESAKKKDFIKAEALRNKLFDVDSFALTQIVKAGEIIEEEKRGAISTDHLSIWAALYKTLNQQETTSLYGVLKEIRIEPDQRIFRQGERMPRLFLIDAGHAKLTFVKGDREILLRKVGPGDIVGEKMFFSNTVCTSSLIALTAMRIQYIDQESIKSWAGTCPALEDKLLDYCNKQKSAEEGDGSANRRIHTRVKISGGLKFQLLDEKGAPVGNVFQGELSDISLSGLSFYVKITVRDNARMLLGRLLGMKAVPSAVTLPEPIVQSGIVVAVHSLPFEEHSVHVRFHRQLPPATATALKLTT